MIVRMMAVVGGFNYSELRAMPVDELLLLHEEVARIARVRAEASKPKRTR